MRIVTNSKSLIRVLAIVMSGWVILAGGSLRARQAPVSPDAWVCFPSCGADGKMMSIPGQGQNTLAGTSLLISLNAAPDASLIHIGFFDGDSGGAFDVPGSSPLQFDLYADPNGDSTGLSSSPLQTWFGAAMADNAWEDMPAITNTAAARSCADCAYHYVLRIANLDNAAVGLSNFKIRTDGTIGVRPQAISYINPQTSAADLAAIYPNYPSLVPTLYDGQWRFGFTVPAPGASQVTVWDGDLDWGSFDCLTKDTDDPDTPARPSLVDPRLAFLETPSMVNEGVAVGTINCPGGGKATGAPADNSNPALGNVRNPASGLGPNLLYRLLLPNGTEYVNFEPSGNREWERFVLDADPNTPFDRTKMDYKVPSLPAGSYEVVIEGNDSGNLNFFYSDYNLLGLPPSGPPAPEDAFYRIGRLVWYDTNRNGVPDSGEPVIPGVFVTVRDDAGNTQFGVTGSDGQFFFRKPAGTYTVVVGSENFSGPLAGLRSTTGGETKTGVSVDSSTPYAEAIFGYVANRSPETPGGSVGCVCSGTAPINVLANSSDLDGDTLTVSAITQPSHGTATLNADYTVTYTPTEGYTGSDAFTYTVSDGNGGTATGTETISVTNTAPVAIDDAAITLINVPVTVSVSNNDSDVEDGTPAIQSIIAGAPGSMAQIVAGQIVYTPPPGFVGEDVLTYVVRDHCGIEATATVRITVAAPSIALIKRTNGTNNNAAPGLHLVEKEAVTWTYEITNTGNVPLTNLVLSDDKLGVVACPVTSLAAGASTICSASGIAAVGQYTNIGTVTGKPPVGPDVTASDPDNYFAEPRRLDVSASPVCIADTPYVNFNIAAANFTPDTGSNATLTWKDSLGNVVQTTVIPWTNVSSPLAGQVLWPGATVDANGHPTDWPGWLFQGGQWVPGSDGFENTRPTATVDISVNPTATVTVNYPPPTASCNASPAKPAITLVKKTNGTDNNSAPGVYVLSGSVVTWTYEVTNTGNVPLTNLTLTDDKIGAVTCPVTSLAAGASTTCTATGTAQPGQYTNVGTVTGTAPEGETVSATNPDNYFGATPSISLVKKTNGTDNNAAPGVYVAPGSTVTWTYDVTNTGNVALTNLSLTDDKIGPVSCPVTSLAAGASTTCTATGTAQAGQYTNMGTVTGKPPVGPDVSAHDPDNYYGAVPNVPTVASVTTCATPVTFDPLAHATYVAGPLHVTAVSTPAQGTAVLNANGTITYTPNQDCSADAFTFTVAYDQDRTVLGNVTVTVSNAPPVGGADSAVITAPASSVDIAVLANDSDPEGKPLSITAVGAPAHGVATLLPNGQIRYVPVVGFNGTDTFTYTLKDFCGATVIVQVVVTVNSCPPIQPGPFTTFTQGGWGTTPHGNNPGALLAAKFASVYPLGFVQIGGGKTLKFTSASAVAAFLPRGGTPSALSTNATNATSSAAGVFAGQVLTLQLNVDFSEAGVTKPGLGSQILTAGKLAGASVSQVLALANAALGGGSLPSGVSLSDLNGVVDAINNNYDNGSCDNGYLRGGGTCATPPSVTLTKSVNKTTANPGDQLVYTLSYKNTGGSAATGVMVSDVIPAHTTFVSTTGGGVNTSGTVSWTLASVGAGASGSLTLTVKLDATFPNGTTTIPNSATIRTTEDPTPVPTPTVKTTVTVVAQCVILSASNDEYSTNKGHSITILANGILGNDVDAAHRALSVAQINGSTAKVGVSAATAHGSVKANADGSFTYTPASGFYGTDSFTYRAKVSDGTLSNVATVTINVVAHFDGDGCDHDRNRSGHRDGDNCEHDRVVDDHYAGDGCDHDRRRNGHRDGDNCAHDRDVRSSHTHYDGDRCDHDRNRNGHRDGDGCSHDRQTHRHYDGDGCDHDRDRSGHRDGDGCDHDKQTYHHNDGDGCDHDRNRSGHYAGDDCDHDRDEHHHRDGDDCDHDRHVNGHYDGDRCSHDREHHSGDDHDNDGQVCNNPPVAANNSYTTPKNTALTIASNGVLGNDTDLDGGTLAAMLVSSASHGSVSLNSNGGFTYTPTSGFTGTDTFTYKAKDPSGALSNVATVTITVTEPPCAGPNALNDAYSTFKNKALSVSASSGVLDNDSDPQHHALTASLVSGPSHGTVTVSANGAFLYTPASDYTGTDAFTYRAADDSKSDTATVTITITNRAPTADNEAYSTHKGTTLSVSAPGVVSGDNDPDGDAVTAMLVDSVDHGSLTLGSNGSFTYKPSSSFTGTDHFTYKVKDSSGAYSNVATVTITVTAHWDGDKCDHDKHKNGHRDGDGCDHDRGR